MTDPETLFQNAVFFDDGTSFRQWLQHNHSHASELLVGFYKVSSGKTGLTYPQAVDHALCYGWIDGIMRSINKDCYCIRFTPRRASSTWSDVNIRKVERLIEQNLMTRAGMDAYNRRKPENSGIYSYENGEPMLSPEFELEFKNERNAWDFFKRQPASYRNMIIRWIMSAKKEATSQSRLEKAINASLNQKRMFEYGKNSD